MSLFLIDGLRAALTVDVVVIASTMPEIKATNKKQTRTQRI